MTLVHDFEWDSAKARANLSKHGISFMRATEVFLDPFALSIFDRKHSKSEDRWVTVGVDLQGAVLVVVHTYRQQELDRDTFRLISARRATKRERAQYAKGI